jgi:hypothetical protein
MQIKKIIRYSFMVFIVVLLLLPSALTAITWSTINLLVATIAVAISIAALNNRNITFSLITVFASIAISIPPYPTWIYSDNDGNWYFNIGTKIENLEVGGFFIHFVICIILFQILRFLRTKKSSLD